MKNTEVKNLIDRRIILQERLAVLHDLKVKLVGEIDKELPKVYGKDGRQSGDLFKHLELQEAQKHLEEVRKTFSVVQGMLSELSDEISRNEDIVNIKLLASCPIVPNAQRP